MNAKVRSCETGSKDKNKDHHKIIKIGASCKLTLDDIKSLITQPITVEISKESKPLMKSSYDYLKSCVAQRLPVYGVNTNFGDQVTFVDLHLNDSDELYYKAISTRQIDIVKSLACGLGEATASPIVKITMMLRAHCLSQGYSGVSSDILDTMLSFLNAGITPVIQRYGSIGASGDLIPLSTIAAGIMGENVDVMYRGEVMKAPQAIKMANLKNATLEMRDGLALINGTSFMTAIASVALVNLKRLYQQMLFAIGMALESMQVINSAYHPLVHKLKYQSGQIAVDGFFLDFWKNSKLLTNLDDLRSMTRDNHATNTKTTKPMQDYYSLRAVPQGFGPFQENLETATRWIENEMNSVNDNPIIDLVEKKIHHNANFMGYYITDACDSLKMNIAQASTWLHALLANMVHPRKSHGLPTNLAFDPAKNNGFRSLQLLAAALAVQNRKLAQSHQAFMIPTEGDNQDVNSLGTHAAFDLQESVANLERLTTILMLASSQALEIRGIEKAGDKSQEIYRTIRQYSPTVVECRPMTDEINNIIQLLQEEKI
jgi:histidine ammonia-lyase